MNLESFESVGLKIAESDVNSHLEKLSAGFEMKLPAMDGCFQNTGDVVDRNLISIIGIENAEAAASLRTTFMEATKELVDGVEKNGGHSLGLKEISSWNINSEYYVQNLKQHAGYAAEVISTYKENLKFQAEGSDIRTFRADDLPELYQRNDQFVDKVRIDRNGNIIERIQTKFVGKTGNEWVSKMMSSKFEKYLDGEHVDKLECPSDYYDQAKASITERIEKLTKQLNRVKDDGKTEVAEGIQKKIDKLNRIDEMIEKSNTSSDEALYAVKHPERYAAKKFIDNTSKIANSEGLKSGIFAAGITFTVSTVQDISSYIDGEMSMEDMITDVTKDTGAAAALGYGTAFVSTAVSQTMKSSASQLVQRVGGSCAPAAVVSFAVESYDSISDFAQDEIDAKQLAYELGENAAGVAASFAAGAAAGALAGPVGAVVGGVVGCVVATEAYETAVEIGSEHASDLASKAQEFANQTIDAVAETVPDQLDNAKAAFNDFIGNTHLPFSV